MYPIIFLYQKYIVVERVKHGMYISHFLFFKDKSSTFYTGLNEKNKQKTGNQTYKIKACNTTLSRNYVFMRCIKNKCGWAI